MQLRTGTIVALSSGLPPSGIAVVRASGPGAAAVGIAFGAGHLVPRRAALRTIVSPADGSRLDSALCLYFPGPASSTGEDVLEMHLHGSPALVERVLCDAAALPDVRLAEPGEFTLRAVLNGRMGLTDAEALADLIEARTESERRRAARLAAGVLSRTLADWREQLVALLALAEAHLDFPDEGDVPGAVDIDPEIVALAGEIDAVLSASREAEKLTDGLLVAFVGPPNAGKSSLFNALAGREAAIVSPEPGTTRDVVTVTLDLGGYRVTLADTAGIREGATGVEAVGIARSEALARSADLVVSVRSPDTESRPDPPGAILVAHKADLAPGGWGDGRLPTALSRPDSLADLSAVLTAAARDRLASAESALVTRARQRAALADVSAALRAASAERQLELKAELLRVAAAAHGSLTGEIGVADVLAALFGRFCIGK